MKDTWLAQLSSLVNIKPCMLRGAADASQTLQGQGSSRNEYDGVRG